MQASEIIARVTDILQDKTNVRWTEAELIQWINDAQREVVMYRPEAYSVNTTFQLASNQTKQTLPAAAMRLLDVIRNMGNGATAGRAIRLIQREILDAQRPDWHSDTASSEIKHYMFDSRDPRSFYVYPKPASSTYIELLYTAIPAAITNSSGTLTVRDDFLNSLVDYVCFRAYTKDAEYAANGQRAVAHYQAFATAMGIKSQVDVAFGPAANSPLNPNNPGAPRAE